MAAYKAFNWISQKKIGSLWLLWEIKLNIIRNMFQIFLSGIGYNQQEDADGLKYQDRTQNQ